MSFLLSVDPGLRKCGAALWRDGRLVEACLLAAEPKDYREQAEVVQAMLQAALEWIFVDQKVGDQSGGIYLRVVCEYPRTYGGRSSKGDANDLIGVALVAGAILGRLACPSRLVLPEDWKGSAPKPKTKAQYVRDGYVVEQRARLKLEPDELARVRLPGKDWKKSMDVWDAVGIGLWKLER